MTFRYPSEQAERAYDKIARLFPENTEIQKKAEDLYDWYWKNYDYFEHEGDDPEVEYPVVNTEAQAAGVPFSEWKNLTDEEKKEVAEAIKNGKTYLQWCREQRNKKRAESEE